AQRDAAQAALDDWDAREPDDVLLDGRPNPGWRVWQHTHAQREAAVDAARSAVAAAEAGAAALGPLDPVAERSVPLALDLSSRRVRTARWVLSAVRAGQPLGAVLGYQFERDLTDAGLQRYLAAFRKLTRF